MITLDCLSALPQTDHTTFSLRRVPLAYGETFGDLSHGSTPLPLWLLTQIFDHRSTTNIANNTSNIGHKKRNYNNNRRENRLQQLRQHSDTDSEPTAIFAQHFDI